MNKDDAIMGTLVVLGITIVAGLLYGLLIYNNNQNIKRDEFYASHCKNVTKSDGVLGNSWYECGLNK